MAKVDAVVGNSHKALLPQLLLQRSSAIPARPPAGLETGPETGLENFVSVSAIAGVAGAPVFADDSFAHADLAAGDLLASGDTRPNLKVQDGCANRCTFCIIPTTRGRSRSVSLPRILESVNGFVAAGGNELVLSGINLGRWGRDLTPPLRLEHLVAAILDQTSLARLRLSSVEPMDWSAELLALYREYGRDDAAPTGPRLARHAHLPLQSGADAVLRAMHRRYRPWHYAGKLAAIRKAMPLAAIGADVMVGFPGETEPLFEESYRFIGQQPFTYLHLFPFSARPGTAAWTMAQQQPVPGSVVKERMARLRALIEAKQAAYRDGLRGRRLPVITLKASPRQQARGVTPALSDTFVSLEVDSRGATSGSTISANRMLWICVGNVQRGDGTLPAGVISA